uniref:Replication factor A n=1 Tax=viral metagenome TaxID=1070528 RepID=A0A6H1ZU47_9ZZZZ
MAEIKYKTEVESILNRLRSAGVQNVEQEVADVSTRYGLLVDEWRVPASEATRTVVQAMLKKHGIETKYWQTGGTASMVTVDQVKADNEWLSLRAKVVQIWENRSDKVARTGLIGDSTGVIKFTIFQKNEDIIPSNFTEGESYLFENVVSSVWNGQFNVKGNKNSTITPIAEDVEVSRKTDTITGVITTIGTGSGLIKRCPECNRALVKGSCGEHGKVEGKFDLRIKAVFSIFGGNELIDLIIGTEATEALTGMSVTQAKDMAMESLDTAVIEDKFTKELIGRYYEVVGAMLQKDSMLVESIKPASVCTAKTLANAMEEIKSEGGN